MADTYPWAEKHKLSDGTVTVDGREYEYWILSRNLESRLPSFVGVIDKERGLYMVSEDVLPDDCAYWLAHEIREDRFRAGKIAKKYGPIPWKKANPCLSAMIIEIEEAAGVGALSWDYLIRRRNFFDGLLAFLKATNDPRGEKFINQVRETRNYLQGYMLKACPP